jgi:hypothetical protein
MKRLPSGLGRTCCGGIFTSVTVRQWRVVRWRERLQLRSDYSGYSVVRKNDRAYDPNSKAEGYGLPRILRE